MSEQITATPKTVGQSIHEGRAFYRRKLALSFATQFEAAAIRAGVKLEPENVVETARTFEAYLEGGDA